MKTILIFLVFCFVPDRTPYFSLEKSLPYLDINIVSGKNNTSEWRMVSGLLKHNKYEKQANMALSFTDNVVSIGNDGRLLQGFCNHNNIFYDFVDIRQNKSFIPIHLAIDAKLGCLVSIETINNIGEQGERVVMALGIDKQYIWIYDPLTEKIGQMPKEDFMEWWTGCIFTIYSDSQTKEFWRYRE